MERREVNPEDVQFIQTKIKELMLEASRRKVPCYAICATGVKKHTYYDDMVSPLSCLMPAGTCREIMQHALLSKGFTLEEDENGEIQIIEE